VALLAAVAFTAACSAGGSLPGAETAGNASSTALAGNWEWKTTSQGGGKSSFAMGPIAQSGNALRATMRITSDCFPGFPVARLEGAVSGDGLTFTSETVDGTTLSATVVTNGRGSASGTFRISGACADHGSITMSRVPIVTGSYRGTAVADSSGASAGVSVALKQSASADAKGLYRLSGAITFTDSPCLASGELDPWGIMLGSTLAFGVTKGDASVTIGGRYVNPSSNSSWTGTYRIESGPCSGQTGTISLMRE
jgi:hypothetical protein